MKNFILIVSIVLFFSCNTHSNPELPYIELLEVLQEYSEPFTDDNSISYIINEIKDEKFVLLGEASHGTHDYYRIRSEISKKLISDNNFSFIAVEGDWGSLYRLNKYVKGLKYNDKSAVEVLKKLDRWPIWMWSNHETAALAEWLRNYNEDLPYEDRVGFYGMDVYGLWDSIQSLLKYFDEVDPDIADDVRSKLALLIQHGQDPHDYVRSVARTGRSSQGQVNEVLNILIENKEKLKSIDSVKYFNAYQDAHVIKNAEEHYRSMIAGGAESWNSRVRHFKSTVERLAEYYGEGSKGIVWAHNTHVGDAAATSMLQQQRFNIGHLLRRKYGMENVFIIGFGTYTGKVNAGFQWGSSMQVMDVPNGIYNSWEDVYYNLGRKMRVHDIMTIFKNRDFPDVFNNAKGHRAIGVVYNPMAERGNYVPTLLHKRYDAFIFIRETASLNVID